MSVSFETLRERAEQIRELRVLSGHTDAVLSVAFSPDGKWLASASFDHTVRLWEVETGRELRMLVGDAGRITSVVFSPDGQRLATACWENAILIWEVKSGRKLRTLTGHTKAVWKVVFSPDGRMLASASYDKTARLWEVESDYAPNVLTGHTHEVCSVNFSPDGRWLATSSSDRTVRLWGVRTSQLSRILTGHTELIPEIAFSPDGSTIASAGWWSDNTVLLWDVDTGHQLRKLTKCQGVLNTLKWSPDGSVLVVRSQKAPDAIRLLHLETGQVIYSLPQLEVQRDSWWITRALDISPDGRLLVTYPPNSIQSLCLWDISALDIGPKPQPKETRPEEIAVTTSGRDSLRTHLVTLPLSHTVPPTPPRPAAWLRGVGAVGTRLPLCFAQDFGSLLTQPRQRLVVARPAHLPAGLDTSAYRNFLDRLAKHPLLGEISSWDISESVAGVVLARLFSGVSFPESYALPGGAETAGFARRLAFELESADPARIWRETGNADRPDLARLLPASAMSRIEANLRQLDADELRFLHRYGPRFSGAPDPRSLLDLFNLLQLPPAIRLALSQVLRLLPRVSEATSVGGMQTYSIGGYGGIARKGNLDNLLLTELAYPEEMLLHRLLNQEALYYGRETERERQRELAYIVTQAGVEMKGDGEVLARALTLALAQTMQRRGYEVLQSFVGGEWSAPEPMNRPTDVQRTLYYRDEGGLRAEEMLEAVTGQIRNWGERYRGIQVLWVVSEHWDADDWDAHTKLYDELRRKGGQQAWFIRVGEGWKKGNGAGPVAASQFHRHEVIENSLLWSDREPPLQRKHSPPQAPQRDWERWRDEIERRGFLGRHDVLHFAEENAQLALWERLAEIEEDVEQERIGDYLRSLAPEEMIYIPAGIFLMGSNEYLADGPQHEVRLRGYYIGRYPVTNAEYREFIEAGGYEERDVWT